MWKSQKQKRKEVFERALAEIMPAALQVADKWTYFSNTLVFKEQVPLSEQVRLFSIPLADVFPSAFPNISKTDPMVYLATLLIGVYLAETHSIPDVLGVARHIEGDLGVEGIEALVAQFIQGTPNR